jgi:serine/threonine-protein kinase HipA
MDSAVQAKPVTSMNKFSDDDAQLYIEGLNTDFNRIYYAEKKGYVVRVAAGVYVDAKLSDEQRAELVLKNAARIASRLVPNGCLGGSSALHRGAVEGHLMMITPRGGKAINVDGVFSIYVQRGDIDIGMNGEVEHVSIEDSLGAHALKCMSDEMLILKNFMQVRTRPAQTYLNNADLNSVVERSMRKLGGKAALMARLQGLALNHGMAGYLKRIGAYVDNSTNYTQAPKPLQHFDVYWHRSRVAALVHDGQMWKFDYAPNVHLTLSCNERRGKGSPPSFLASLLPEAGLKAGDSMEDNLGDFKRAHRYISNITVKSKESKDKSIIIDTMDGKLGDFRSRFLEFTGVANPDLRGALDDDRLMSSLHRDPDTPRMSGMQVKLPGFLSRDGEMHSARGRSFTHIIKVVGSNQDYSSMCSMEWFSLTIAKASGIQTEEFAIANLGGYGPSLIAERFDIRSDLNDTRMILTEDFWSLEGMTKHTQKYEGELMKVADAILKYSTDTTADGLHLLKQVVFSWLTFNGDLHLKNMMLLKESTDGMLSFNKVRLSPVYDVMCTQVYPEDPKASAIALGGKRDHSLAGFRALGARFGIKAPQVDAVVEHLATSIPLWSARISKNLPAAIASHPKSVSHIEQAIELFDIRCCMVLQELEDSQKLRATKSDNELEMAMAFSAEDEDSASEHIQADRRRSGRRP